MRLFFILLGCLACCSTAWADIANPVGTVLVLGLVLVVFLVQAAIYLGLPLLLVWVLYQIWLKREEILHPGRVLRGGPHKIKPHVLRPEWRNKQFVNEMAQLFTGLRQDFMAGQRESLLERSEGQALEAFERGIKNRGSARVAYTCQVRRVTLLEASRQGEDLRLHLDIEANHSHDGGPATPLHERWWVRSDGAGWVLYERHTVQERG